MVRRPVNSANPVIRGARRARELAREGGWPLLRERVTGKLRRGRQP
jgi:hypothetical protein